MAIEWPSTKADVFRDDPLGILIPKTWAHYHSYGGWGKFFKGLAAGRLLATQCTNPECEERHLWLPPRCECPDCWHEMAWREAPTTGRIFTWSVVRYPGELFRLPPETPLISVEIDGVCTKLMSYLKKGKPEIGMPVEAVFNTKNPTNTILDLAWVPA
ncbi:MAG TPA: OB-fold domain-containing protein [Phycisphaerae bacterium]|nr:OB-fold domain-containing protein [Phycisphaerae bacterium]HRW51454.1 OB-fold domain-containing protein [Phycisphaerae bacterium]